MIRAVVAAVALLCSSCSSCGGLALVDCGADRARIVEALEREAATYDEADGAVVERLDVLCKSPEDVNDASLARALSACGRARVHGKSGRVESCALRRGSHFYRARVVVTRGADDVDAQAAHELRHLRRRTWALDDACADHRASCWED